MYTKFLTKLLEENKSCTILMHDKSEGSGITQYSKCSTQETHFIHNRDIQTKQLATEILMNTIMKPLQIENVTTWKTEIMSVTPKD